MPSPSITAAIEQLRAEIIAPDWQLSPQRISRLRIAFARLNSFYADQSHALALLKMAISVVDHIEHHGPQTKALDFLKEDMAHIVSLYEDDSDDQAKEKEIVSRAYKRFRRLNISLTKGGSQAIAHEQKTLDASELLDKLEIIAKETALLPRLLDQTAPLSPEERNRTVLLLGKISTAIQSALTQLAPAPK